MKNLSAIIAIFIVIFMFLYSSLAWGYVTHNLYEWFIRSSFQSAPFLSVPQFIGLSFFIRSLNPNPIIGIKDEYKDNAYIWASFIMNPIMTFIFGYIAKIIWF